MADNAKRVFKDDIKCGLLPDLLRSLIPQRHTQKMADPDPMTCDPGSRVYDPDPGTVIPDPIYLVTTL